MQFGDGTHPATPWQPKDHCIKDKKANDDSPKWESMHSVARAGNKPSQIGKEQDDKEHHPPDNPRWHPAHGIRKGISNEVVLDMNVVVQYVLQQFSTAAVYT